MLHKYVVTSFYIIYIKFFTHNDLPRINKKKNQILQYPNSNDDQLKEKLFDE